jgi:hypothetical protein
MPFDMAIEFNRLATVTAFLVIVAIVLGTF